MEKTPRIEKKEIILTELTRSREYVDCSIMRQSHRGVNFGYDLHERPSYRTKKSNVFFASNGYALESVFSAAFSLSGNHNKPTLFCRGSESSSDHNVIHIPSHHYDNVLEAIAEYNSHFSDGIDEMLPKTLFEW